MESIHKVPKDLVRCDGHNCETKAWGLVARSQNANADMIVRTEHTDTEYVYVIDPEKVNGGA